MLNARFVRLQKILANRPRRFLKKSKRTVPFNAPAPMDGRITPVAIGETAKKDCFAENCTARK
jgi:hypothetical protein